jgi:hypothetical protein
MKLRPFDKIHLSITTNSNGTISSFDSDGVNDNTRQFPIDVLGIGTQPP